MGVFEKMPYTNFHELNINWVLKKLKEMEDDINDLKETAENLDERVTALENESE